MAGLKTIRAIRRLDPSMLASRVLRAITFIEDNDSMDLQGMGADMHEVLRILKGGRLDAPTEKE